MDDFSSLLTAALSVVSIATLAGLGLLRGVVSGLRERLKDSDDELARKERRLTEAETEVSKLKSDIAALSRVVTGEAHWVAIGQKLDEHHNAAEIHWNNDEVLLADIRDRLPGASGGA